MSCNAKPAEEIGAHHCTRENAAFAVNWLQDVADGKKDINNIDWVGECSVLAVQMKWLLNQLDDS